MGKSLRLTKVFLAGIFFSALSHSTQILDPTLTPRFIVLAVFLMFAAFMLYRSELKLNWEIDIITSSYFLFALFCVASISWANTNSEAFFESSKVVLSLAVFGFAYFSLKHDAGFLKNNLCKFSVAVVFIGAGFAFSQYSKIRIHDKESLYQITALNGHKNLYASFLFLNLFFLIGAAMDLKGFLKLLSYIAIALALLILVFIKTKAVWIGLLLTALIFGFLYVTKKIKLKFNFYISLIVCVLLANLFFAYVVPMGIEKGLSHNEIVSNSSTQEQKEKELDSERLMLFHKTYDMIGKHPFIGVGMGNWQIYFPDATLSGMWRAEDLNFTFQRPHNDWLWILSETGWIGLNLFFVFIFSVLLLLSRALRNEAASKRSHIEMMLSAAFIIGFFTISFFDFPKERIEHLIFINIILALAYYQIKNNSGIEILKKINLSSGILFCIMLVILFSCVIGVLRYRGEYYTRKMYDEKALKNEVKAIDAGYEALSFAYCLDPTSVPIYWYTANAYANLQNYQKAHADFLLALKHNPYNRNVLNDLGSSYAFTNNKELAKKYYEEALRISPRFDDPKLNLAALYIQEKNWAKADTCLRSMLHDSERRSKYQKMVDAFK
ncbi:MAG TPA: O-antigen ligase family protein [Bacteroidia bacterium]|jgi:O-antigen ligase|nr:O-antigen ligase family protein [Bacteroidia bacterium]